MPDEQKKPAKKPAKKLELKKETIQELSDSDLDQVAGGDATGATAGGASCGGCPTFYSCNGQVCTRPTLIHCAVEG